MSELNKEAIDALAALATKGLGPQSVPGGNIPYVLVPDGYAAKAMPELIYNEHQKVPERMKGSITVLDPASFAEYYTLFSDENSRVFGEETARKILAVLDYHGALAGGGPRWCQHRLTLELRESVEWKAWFGSNGKGMTQQAFAEFLEQNSLDITSPSPASIVEVAGDLQMTTEVAFGSGIRQLDGQITFKYTEEAKVTVGKGQVQIPDHFTIQIPAFVGGERVSIDALLRFRLKDQKITFWYTLVRPDAVVRAAFAAARNLIAETLKITIINGSPAA